VLYLGFKWGESVRLKTSDGEIAIRVTMDTSYGKDVQLNIDAPQSVDITRTGANVKFKKKSEPNEPT
jgi:sRNA-binding carbon storage regulator CsrA